MVFVPKGRGYGIAQPVTCTELVEVNLVLWFDISTSSMHRRLTIKVYRSIDAYWYKIRSALFLTFPEK